jgi:hypothetical protein
VKLKNNIMKRTNNFLLVIIIGIIGLSSCSNNKEASIANVKAFDPAEIPAKEEQMSQEASDQVIRFVPPQIMPNFIATKAASTGYDDGVHKFIRSAKMKFKVRDVTYATQEIEDIIIKNRGFIITSAINNNNPATKTIKIAEDSACIIHYNNLTASLTLRIPQQLLDSTLRQIAPLAILIDYRTVEATDVTAQLMSDKMKQERLAKKQSRISNAISGKRGQLEEVMNAEEALDNALKETDKTILSEYNMNDNIAYSSIYIDLYQDQTEYMEKVLCNTENIKTYEPGFGAKVINAFSDGWAVICIVFLFLINIWPVLILLGIAIFAYTRIRKKENH